MRNEMIKELKLEIQAVMNRTNRGELNSVDATVAVIELQSSIISLLEQQMTSTLSHSNTEAEQGCSATVLRAVA